MQPDANQTQAAPASPQQMMANQQMATPVIVTQAKQYGVMSTTGGEWVSSIPIGIGFITFVIAGILISELEVAFGFIMFGLSFTFFFAGVVSAIHSVEKAILNQNR